MSAPETIRQLVERFQEQHAAYRLGKYNETQLRRDFLDPFFEALGWDVSNHKGHAEKYREVIHEVSVEVERQAKAADYAFRVGDRAIFFVEAKKPAVNIETSFDAAFQVRRYGWSAKLPICLLSDFEQLAVYDCRSKPNHADPASLGRVKLYSFKDYLDKWDEISAIFSREAVLKGSFDQFADGLKGKRGTADVDDAFLAEMERWREDLARNIALRNPGLNQRDVNYAVQTTIDRLIFLRICEDRGIEAEDSLRNATDGKDVYQDLVQLFRLADKKYNSGLFHFSEEKGQSSQADTLTLDLKIDDKILKDILAHLYYPLSPYAFKYISVDILGQVYERFLGKVIRLTAGHQAKVEEKPEVRKAGGVYYTPTYIVKYIVKNTLGDLLNGKSVDDQKTRPLRVIDPACGSGSFLLGAYQYLLDWYLDWYVNNDPNRYARGKSPAIMEGRDGWQLTMNKKKEILLNHIYGVDIDNQAVEVTKLSLLLKVVENPGQLSLLSERILPDLGQNIRCGNSLIGPDYYDARQMPMFGDEELYRINIFDWKSAFPAVFAAGGFDAVIGNPPYIRIQALQEWAPEAVEYYKKRYQAASKGNYDIYVVFVEKALSLMNPSGRLGYILPHKFFNAQYGQSLRGLLSAGKHLAKVVHFSDQQVFDGATTYTCLLFLEKTAREDFEFEKVVDLQAWQDGGRGVVGRIEAAKVQAEDWNFNVNNISALFERLAQMPVKLADVSRIFVGTQTSADDVFVLDDCVIEENFIVGFSRAIRQIVKVELSLTKPFLYGKQIRRYQPISTKSYLICPYEINSRGSRLLTISELKKFPLALKYLEGNKSLLSNREKGKFKGDKWYAFGYPKSMNLFQFVKIIVPDYNNAASFTLDQGGHFYKTGYGVYFETKEISDLFVLGLLNSKLLFRYLLSIGTTLRGGYVRFWTQFIGQLPIRPIDFSNPSDSACHTRMVRLVENMLALHKQAAGAHQPQEQEMIQRQIQSTNRQIDRLVYDLYGLSEEEIKLVEGG